MKNIYTIRLNNSVSLNCIRSQVLVIILRVLLCIAL